MPSWPRPIDFMMRYTLHNQLSVSPRLLIKKVSGTETCDTIVHLRFVGLLLSCLSKHSKPAAGFLSQNLVEPEMDQTFVHGSIGNATSHMNDTEQAFL